MKRFRNVIRICGVISLMVLSIVAVYRWVYAESVTGVSWQSLRAVVDYEAPTSTAKTIKAKQELQSIVDTMSNIYGTNVGIVVTDLSNGASARSNADTQFISASIYKLFVAYDIYKKIDAGTLSYSQSLSAYGTSQTVETCLNKMLTVSDNTCGKALGKLCDWARLDAMLAVEGYSHTVLNNYDGAGNLLATEKQTSASDVALLLSRLYAGTLLSKASSEQFLTLLKADQITYMLPAGFPSGTVIAHKVGFLGQYQHDAGIVYGSKKDILVVILTKGWTTAPETQATAAFKAFGKSIQTYMQGSEIGQ